MQRAVKIDILAQSCAKTIEKCSFIAKAKPNLKTLEKKNTIRKLACSKLHSIK